MTAHLTRPPGLRDRIGSTAVMGAIIAGCWRLDCLWVAALWFGAMVTSFWVVFRLRIWTEHTTEDESGEPTHRIAASWWQRFHLQLHNTWCHWEHHLYPQVPAWNLPAVRELTSGDGPPVISLGGLFRKLTARPAGDVCHSEGKDRSRRMGERPVISEASER